jgi:hypothetical protein
MSAAISAEAKINKNKQKQAKTRKNKTKKRKGRKKTKEGGDIIVGITPLTGWRS